MNITHQHLSLYFYQKPLAKSQPLKVCLFKMCVLSYGTFDPLSKISHLEISKFNIFDKGSNVPYDSKTQLVTQFKTSNQIINGV